MNGRYAHDGFHGGKAKFKQVGGTPIIFFDGRGKWKISRHGGTGGWIYEGGQNNSPLPPYEWENVEGLSDVFGAAPGLLLGTCRDLKAEDEVTLVHHWQDMDWTGCPEQARRFSFGRDWIVIIHRIEGDWFFPTNFPSLAAPLAALGSVKLRGMEHRIAGAIPSLAASSAGATWNSGAFSLSKTQWLGFLMCWCGSGVF